MAVDVNSKLRQARRDNLKRLLRPRHVAFVGGRHLDNCIATCRDAGFKGPVWVVNPHYKTLGGLPCVPSLDALPEPPDATFIAVSRERSINITARLSAMGAAGAICHAAGFGELGGEHRALQDDLTTAAGDLALIGPNCMGFVNAFDRVALWGDRSRIEPNDGAGVALISQSGALIYGTINIERVYPVGYGISIGNQAVIDMADVIDAVLDDPRVRCIGLYAEGLTDGRALGFALDRALKEEKPVVLLRGGGTAVSAERSFSHTGNLAVPDDFWRALVTRYRLIDVHSPKQLIETTKLLAVSGVPQGRRLFVASYSGAAGTLIADQAPSRGLVLPPVAPENHDRVRPTLPPEVTISNPLDLNLPWQSRDGVSMDNSHSIARCLADLSHGCADMLAFMLDVPPREGGQERASMPTIDAMIELGRTSGLPTFVASMFPEGLEPELRRRLLDAGVTPLLGMADALDAMAAVANYAEAHATSKQVGHAAMPLLLGAGPSEALVVDEWQSKGMLVKHDLAVPAGWCGTPEEARAAAESLGFPVALKLLSDTIAHKNRVGGVHLHLADGDAVDGALDTMRANLATALPGFSVDRVLVERMVHEPRHELLLGIKRHPELGLGLVIGRGGLDAERWRDYRLVLLPAPANDLAMALHDLGLGLDDTAASSVLRAMTAVAAFATEHAGTLSELDVNPLIVGADGVAIAVDALVVMAPRPFDDDEA